MTAPASAAPRFNPWPYSLVAFFAIAIVGTATLVTIAVTHRTELVAPDYYNQEMLFQRRFDQMKRTLPWEGGIAVDYTAANVRVRLPKEHATLGVTGTIEFYRPSSAGADRSVPLALDGEGLQLLPTPDLASGLWKVRIQWKAGGDEFFADRNLIVPATGTTAPSKG